MAVGPLDPVVTRLLHDSAGLRTRRIAQEASEAAQGDEPYHTAPVPMLPRATLAERSTRPGGLRPHEHADQEIPLCNFIPDTHSIRKC